MKRRSGTLRLWLGAAVFAVIAAACVPTFFFGSSLEYQPVGPDTTRLIWNTAYDANFDAADHLINNYEVSVNGVVVASPGWLESSCLLTGLSGSTLYNIEVTAVTTSGERGDSIPALGVLATSFTTPAGPGGGAIACIQESDADGDRIPDWAETNTGIYVDKTNTGTDPFVTDTDGDGLADGDEVMGTIDGLVLNVMGADPTHKNIFIEMDWFDDSLDCGAHSHRPTAAAVDRVIASFAAAPVSNPDGTTGIDMIVDYGQGGILNRGTVVADTVGVVGNIDGGVNGTQYAAIKDANFHPVRENYFHYSLHIHRYNSSSDSSGQAELPGDDQIVSLQCFDGLTNTSNTIMHELGHNLGIFHGGDAGSPNYKPNYNSVMNYQFQFPGVDAELGAPGGCDTGGDQILDYSDGDRLVLNELALNEAVGVCGSPALDWNGNSVLDPGLIVADINNGDGLFNVLVDHDDWAAIDFAAVAVDGADGARLVAPQVIDEQSVPADFQN